MRRMTALAPLSLLLALGAAERPGWGEDLRSIAIDDLLTFNSVRPGFGSSQVQISPDGRYVVFQMRKTHLNENRYTYDLWLIRVDEPGSEPRQLTRNEPTRSATQWLTPRWSPDSKKVAYFSPRSGRSQIALIDVDTMEEVQLTRSGGLRAGFDDRRPHPGDGQRFQVGARR
jgi:Tol biopolymer transport system component